jgi:nickel-type superoxide dismutase maturation protease
VVLAALGAGLAGVGRLLRRVEVVGASMAPGLLPGDRLLMRRLGSRSRLEVGAIVGFEDPRPERETLLIKRVASIDGDVVMVLGDNPRASTDSRIFGPIRRAEVGWILMRRYGRATTPR